MIENQGQQGQRIVTIYDDIYNLADCRAYYQAMYNAGFRTAHHASTGYLNAAAALKDVRDLTDLTVVDFASGYGIAAQLMRFDITLEDVLSRYQSTEFADYNSDQIIASDQDWLAEHLRPGRDRYYGIDIADQALSYGQQVGIFDQAFAENLQDEDPSNELTAVLKDVDLIVECGSVAHMLPKALKRMLDLSEKSPWIITAPIRGNDTAEAFALLEDAGLSVEKLGAPFRHRQFSSPDEQIRAIENAQKRGHQTEGYEDQGYFHAQLYLSRPLAERIDIK